MKKRHLRDLYVRGKLVTLNDEEPADVVEGEDGEPVVDPNAVQVYIKKLNMHENEVAFRQANQKRAATIAASKDPEHPLYKAVAADVMDMSVDDMKEKLISLPLAEKRESVEAECASQPEWEEHNFLQGLTDAWREGLQDKYLVNAEDEEAKPVYEHLLRFSDEVEAILDGERQAMLRDLGDVPEAELRERTVVQMLHDRADLDWSDAYRKSELMFAIRDPEDHTKKYFETLEDLDELEKLTLLRLLTEYRSVSVDPKEGKG